jgi:hypothetical protein
MEPDCHGGPTSDGYNLIVNTAGCSFTNTTGDKVNKNLKGSKINVRRLASGSVSSGRALRLLLLHRPGGAPDFLPVKLEEAVGDHAGRLIERQLGLLDQVVLLDGLTPTTRTLLRRF